MSVEVAAARDQMSALFKTAADARNLSLAANLKLITVWDDKADQPTPPQPPTPWARFNVRHATGGQTSLSGGLGLLTRYTRAGTIIVQVFTVGGAGNVVADELVTMILTAFEGKTTTGGLVFRRGRFNEIGQSGDWHQTNVSIDFEYDTVK